MFESGFFDTLGLTKKKKYIKLRLIYNLTIDNTVNKIDF